MKILITGGTSTIGKHLKSELSDAIYLSSADCDLRDSAQTNAMFQQHKPDVLIHLAAIVGGIQDNIARPVEYLQDNLLINTNSIKAAYDAGTNKIIALSSTCAYPDISNRYPLVEEDVFVGPPAATNFGYAYSKRCMAALLECYNQQHSTKYCHIIPSNLYSELDSHKRERAHFVTALLHKIQAAEISGTSTIKLLGTGAPFRQFTYAGDVARIIKTMIQNDVYQSFNVSNPEILTINQLAEITLQELGLSHWNIEYTNPELDGQYRKDVSINKLRTFFPDFMFTPFANGIKKVYNSIISNTNRKHG